MSQLTSEICRVVLQKEFADSAWTPNDLGALAGGYVLRVGDALMPPGCCGDLSNLQDWRIAAEYAGTAWQPVWIGHPWTHIRAEGETLHLAEPTDPSQDDGFIDAVSVARRDLRTAIERAAEGLEHFRELLVPLVEELKPTIPSRDVVRVLLHGPPALR